MTAATLSVSYTLSLLGGLPSLRWLLHPVRVYALFIVLATCCLLAAVASDIWRKRRTDWMHWTGVAVCLSLAVVQLGSYVRLVWIR
jgi:hypothetical protein